MKIHLASDHAGFHTKEQIKYWLLTKGYSVVDHGATEFVPTDDYPRYGKMLAKAVAKEKGKGILFCGSGVGMAMVANRFKGARAVEGMTLAQVKLSRQHNDSNVLALGEWQTPLPVAKKLITLWLKTKFSGATRHRRRLKQLDKK